MNQRGVDTVQLVLFVVILGIVAGAFFWHQHAVDGAREEGRAEGRKAALLEVAQRDNAQLAAAGERIRDLEREKDSLERGHRERMQAIDIQREWEVQRVHAEKDRIIAGLRARARQLLDAGPADQGCSRGSNDADTSVAGAAGERDAKARGGSPGAVVDDEDEDVYTAELLAEGDVAIVDLSACQAVLEDWGPRVMGKAP